MTEEDRSALAQTIEVAMAKALKPFVDAVEQGFEALGGRMTRLEEQNAALQTTLEDETERITDDLSRLRRELRQRRDLERRIAALEALNKPPHQ